jgi:hypothetical protein
VAVENACSVFCQIDKNNLICLLCSMEPNLIHLSIVSTSTSNSNNNNSSSSSDSGDVVEVRLVHVPVYTLLSCKQYTMPPATVLIPDKFAYSASLSSRSTKSLIVAALDFVRLPSHTGVSASEKNESDEESGRGVVLGVGVINYNKPRQRRFIILVYAHNNNNNSNSSSSDGTGSEGVIVELSVQSLYVTLRHDPLHPSPLLTPAFLSHAKGAFRS